MNVYQARRQGAAWYQARQGAAWSSPPWGPGASSRFRVMSSFRFESVGLRCALVVSVQVVSR